MKSLIHHLHTEWFITLLEAVGREVLELVDLLPEDEVRLLADAQGTGGHKGVALHVAEGRL